MAGPGVHRLTVTTGGGSAVGAVEPGAVRGGAQSQRVYWGDMHCHADYADGTGTAEWNHDYARNKARLDFYSLTDPHLQHAGAGDGGRSTGRRCWTCARCGAKCNGQRGTGTSRAALSRSLGYERTPWERRRAAGDLTVWFMEDDADLVIEDTIAETIAAVRETNGAVFIGSHAAQRSDWARYPDDVEDVMPDDRDFGDASACRVVRVRGAATRL